jgi:hypothetical protein
MEIYAHRERRGLSIKLYIRRTVINTDGSYANTHMEDSYAHGGQLYTWKTVTHMEDSYTHGGQLHTWRTVTHVADSYAHGGQLYTWRTWVRTWKTVTHMEDSYTHGGQLLTWRTVTWRTAIHTEKVMDNEDSYTLAQIYTYGGYSIECRGQSREFYTFYALEAHIMYLTVSSSFLISFIMGGGQSRAIKFFYETEQ